MANAYYSDISDFLDYATRKTNQLITETNQQGLQRFVNELIQLADDVTELAEGVPARWEQYQAMLRQKDMMMQTINAQRAQIEELDKMMVTDFGNVTKGTGPSDISDIDADALASEFVDMDDDESPFDFGDSGITVETDDDGGDDGYTDYSTDLDDLVGIADESEGDADEKAQDDDGLPSADEFGDYDDDDMDIDIPDDGVDDGDQHDIDDNDGTGQRLIPTDAPSGTIPDKLGRMSDGAADDDVAVEAQNDRTDHAKGRLTRQDADSDYNDDEDDDGLDFTIDEEFLDF